tara:strand:- start:242 stop:1030 length:789 start_codon:yes stop_codon:yes gene_type:complete
MMKKLTIKPKILITGASSGIGKALAELYIKKGHVVALLARRESLLKEIKETAPKHFQKNIYIYACDIRKKNHLQNSIKSYLSEVGRIDCVIANAGISESSPGSLLDSSIYERIYDINVLGSVYTFEAVIPHMIQNKSGHLVSISSLASFRGLPESGAYCSSKAALSSLTESLRLDLKSHGIDVSLINPGFIKSPMTDKNLFYMPQLLETSKGAKKIYAAIKKKRKVYSFPNPLAWVVAQLRYLPPFIYDFLLKNKKNKKRTK